MSGRLEFQSRPFSSQFSNPSLSANPREVQRGMGSLEFSHFPLSYGSENSIRNFKMLLLAWVPHPSPTWCKEQGLIQKSLPSVTFPAHLASMSITHFSQGLHRAAQGPLPEHQSQPSSVIYLHGGLSPRGRGPCLPHFTSLGTELECAELSFYARREEWQGVGRYSEATLQVGFLRSPNIRGTPPLLGGQDLPQLN